MSQHGKIDWKRLGWAAKETILVMLAGIIMLIAVISPVALSIIFNTYWFILLYPLIFFVINVWEKYNGY